jgi:hypothetical protein
MAASRHRPSPLRPRNTIGSRSASVNQHPGSPGRPPHRPAGSSRPTRSRSTAPTERTAPACRCQSARDTSPAVPHPARLLDWSDRHPGFLSLVAGTRQQPPTPDGTATTPQGTPASRSREQSAGTGPSSSGPFEWGELPLAPGAVRTIPREDPAPSGSHADPRAGGRRHCRRPRRRPPPHPPRTGVCPPRHQGGHATGALPHAPGRSLNGADSVVASPAGQQHRAANEGEPPPCLPAVWGERQKLRLLSRFHPTSTGQGPSSPHLRTNGPWTAPRRHAMTSRGRPACRFYRKARPDPRRGGAGVRPRTR